MGNIPRWNPLDPDGGADFHAFSTADRFNYNGPGFNFLKTPNERVNFYANVTHEIAENISMFARVSYTNRTSETKGAPEPICLGAGCGNRIMDNIVVSALNPYNPFGIDLSVANGNLEFFGRRPLESGPRLFFQDVNTYMFTTGLQGDFSTGDRNFYWDLSAGYGDNRGFQEKYNSHNAAKIAVALGDPSVCAAVPNCVPLNYFGGQGPDGSGSITEEMLDYIRYTQRDFSEQTLKNIAFNISGDIVELPAGVMGFAAGAEYRDHAGSFRPDPIAERGETAGIPSGATVGGFDVTEIYAEVSIPLLAEVTGADLLELNLAARNSDYSTSGAEATYKVSAMWRPISELSVRGSFSTGLRAPGIGELFGGSAREDFNFLDPCADYLGTIGEANGGRDAAQSATIQANCATLGVAPGLAQINPQLSAVSTGNDLLQPESSENVTFGIDASGYDVMFNYASPETNMGQFNLRVNATHLGEYTESTGNPDGSQSVNDLTGRHPDETFFRAFPEWRMVIGLDWARDRVSSGLTIRWVDEMLLDSGSKLDSVAFTDIRATWNPNVFDDALTLSLGFNNVLDEDPPVCDACGVISMSPVSHDLPGRVAYFRVSYELQ